MFIRPLSDIEVASQHIPRWGRIPNTSIQSKPLMIYHRAFEASLNELAQHFKTIGEVEPSWVYTMYRQTHFHSSTHEVLGVISGIARLCFGGEENAERFEPTVGKGDLIIVPAGVGHRLLYEIDATEEPFKMLGAYPRGKTWDMCYGEEGEKDTASVIASLDWFGCDPLYGKVGPVLTV